VDEFGHVLVTDTGNKRIVIFDENGGYISEIGEVGFALGQFDEPTSITVNNQGQVFVADTWNQRIQSLRLTENGEISPFSAWDIVGWYSQSLENKPYITVDERDHVFISDPEGYRILEFTAQGEFVRFWGDFGSGPDGFALVTGLAADGKGGIWVSDSGQNRLMHFTLPTE
jgi:DNA-binding beta-propeller fold protein YncE